ncbi:DUF4150 domain-containing protein [Vibrio sp. S4M6]|uniref:PAAR-like domain-containing protein n=1 Tax=Vibrio sinus TaxID=2946865 RepID=UPI00202A2EDB|nr:PAAR-like domain-containing protein [Vibrio sinus]MCL9781079.1 DUF4150 domain-containing protein [Vibrio sinus]
MPVSINANGLSIVHKGSEGVAKSTQADVCWTTIGPVVVPLPYDNVAKSKHLDKGSATVFADGGNSIAIDGCNFSKSKGDEDGDAKGIDSDTIEGKAEFISCSPTVLIEGQGVCRLSDQMKMNNGNTMCMGGVQNPSVEVEALAEELYELGIHCHYPDREPLVQAEFEMKSSRGEWLASGKLDATGYVRVRQLPNEQAVINYQEDARPYTVHLVASKNIHQQDYKHEDFFALCAESKQPFWRPTRVDSSVKSWGQFSIPAKQDPQFCHMVSMQWLALLPLKTSLQECQTLTNRLLSFLGLETGQNKLNQEQQHALLGLIHQAAPLITLEGKVLSIYAEIAPTESYNTLMAALRDIGYGNPVKLTEQFDWQGERLKITRHLNQLLDKLESRLTNLKSRASSMGYAELEKRYKQIMNQLAELKAQLPNWIKQASRDIKEKLQSIKATDPSVHVTRPSSVGFSTAAGTLYQTVYTTKHYKKLTFDDPKEKILRIGVFFDGTGQNNRNDEYKERRGNKSRSNIARLFEAYPVVPGESDAIYISGVGTVDNAYLTPEVIDKGEDEVDLVQAFGIAIEDLPEPSQQTIEKIEKTGAFYKWQSLITQLHELCNDEENNYSSVTKIEFDVFGFSRGAALARHFVNTTEVGLPDYDKPRQGRDGLAITPNLLGTNKAKRFNPYSGFEIDSKRKASVRFVGLFDTVGSFYWPGNDDEGNFQLSLKPDCAKAVLQLCAYHEYRKNFPLTSLKTNGSLPDNFFEEMFPGAHSDVGGGYAAFEQYAQKGLPERYQVPTLDTYNRELVKTLSFEKEYKRERSKEHKQTQGHLRAQRMMEHTRQEMEQQWNQQCLEQHQQYGQVKCQHWHLHFYRLQPISNALSGLAQERMKQQATLFGVKWKQDLYTQPHNFAKNKSLSQYSVELNSQPLGGITESSWASYIKPQTKTLVHRPHDALINPGYYSFVQYIVNRPTYDAHDKLQRQVFDNA